MARTNLDAHKNTLIDRLVFAAQILQLLSLTNQNYQNEKLPSCLQAYPDLRATWEQCREHFSRISNPGYIPVANAMFELSLTLRFVDKGRAKSIPNEESRKTNAPSKRSTK
jgi:hypothetical protein